MPKRPSIEVKGPPISRTAIRKSKREAVGHRVATRTPRRARKSNRFMRVNCHPAASRQALDMRDRSLPPQGSSLASSAPIVVALANPVVRADDGATPNQRTSSQPCTCRQGGFSCNTAASQSKAAWEGPMFGNSDGRRKVRKARAFTARE